MTSAVRPRVAWASLALTGLLVALPARAQERAFTRADTLRGSVTPERAWWDVHHYDLDVRVSPSDSTIRGAVTIGYLVTGAKRDMQIDLMTPLEVDSVVQGGRRLEHRRDGNAFFVRIPGRQERGGRHAVTVFYGGRPRVAERPPWDGGFIWARDESGNPWVATANQGIGASIWWPNKDHQSDEPDSARIRVTVPAPMVNVSNGRLERREENADGSLSWTWVVRNPINNYTVAVNAGSYAHFADTLHGRAGVLDLDYWVLEPNLERARMQFVQVKPMLRCFEEWFGPYPFYEDGYKLVETPHLGMEHQSAVAYGNEYRNGYRGTDLSGTGWGLTWDFIIVHESGHEWFGNNVTTEDLADMWVHEGFTNYSENLFVECLYGKEAGAAYVIGTRARIGNDRPIIAPYGVNAQGSGDMYYKGGNLLHTLRRIVDDDALWKRILTGINTDFRHQVVTSAEVEAYVSDKAGKDLSKVFDQYLRHTRIPVLEYAVQGRTLRYRWRADVEGFDMPVLVETAEGRREWITPVSGTWKTLELGDPAAFRVDEDFYVEVEEMGGGPDPGATRRPPYRRALGAHQQVGGVAPPVPIRGRERLDHREAGFGEAGHRDCGRVIRCPEARKPTELR